MMKEHIYNRIADAEQCIRDKIHFTLHSQAKPMGYSMVRELVLKPLQIKTMPKKYREQIAATLWFVWKWQVLDKCLYPVLYQGRLYSKWECYPEELKDICRSVVDTSGLRPYPVFRHHFTEGMEGIVS